MKIRWIIPFILTSACGNHQPAAEQKMDSVHDTVQAVKAKAPDTTVVAVAPAIVPAAAENDSIRHLPGPIRVFTVDLNYDSIPDTIALRTLAKDTLSYDRITISITHYGKWSFKSGSNWNQVDDDFPGRKENAYPTNYFFLATSGVECALALFGWVGETERAEFSIIRIRDNQAKMVMDQKHWIDDFIEVPIFVRDMNNDGRLDFGYRHLTDGVTGKMDGLVGFVGNYNPIYVYTIDDSLILNKPVMKKYNQENFIFAGYESGGTMIFRPDDESKKLRVWKSPPGVLVNSNDDP